jgi:SH3-like domain-containing protein
MAGEKNGTVSVGKLNVRVKPGTKFTAVSRLSRGDEVVILEEREGWYRIKAPEDCEVWVASSFIKDGMAISEINLRSGPGVAYNPYCTVKAGTKLNIVDDKREHWSKISPPEGISAWVSSKHIFIPPEKKEVEKKAGTPVAEEKKAEGQNKKEVPAKIEDKNIEGKKEVTSLDALPFIKGSEKETSETGILLPLDDGAVYVTHALAVKNGTDYKPLCYVHAETGILDGFEEKKVEIKGSLKWVKGWKRPVFEVSRIKAVAEKNSGEKK